jgi:O-antigen ligase
MLSLFTKFRTMSFLLLCCLLGGTSQYIFAPKLVLYALSLLIICWTLWQVDFSEIVSKSKTLFVILSAFVLFTLVQLIPFPPSIWTSLPGREVIAEGYALLQMPLPWRPISMAPEKTLFSLSNLLPPIAIYLMVVHFSDSDEQNTAIWGFLFFALITVILGFFQKVSPGGPLHFYDVTNEDLAVGFFSNANHQATLLLMALPFAFAFMYKAFNPDESYIEPMNKRSVAAIIMIIAFILGLMVNTSVAGYMLMIFAVIMSVIMLSMKGGFRLNSKLLLILIVVAPFIGLLLYDAFDSLLSVGVVTDKLAVNGEMSRGFVYRKTVEIMPDYLTVGAGLGAYPDVYRLYESLDNISSVFLPHAHNDYLEILIDMGVFGGFIVVAFWLWWGRTLLRLGMAGRKGSIVAKAATLALLMVMLHSLVDYPLRTLAIGTLFGFSLGLITRRKV